MEAIIELFSNDISSIIIGIFILMYGIVSMYDIVCKFFSIFGKPIGAMKQRKADHDLLMKTVKDLSELHNTHKEDTRQSIRHDEIIRKDLAKLTTTVNGISSKLEIMQSKMDATEMAKLKDKIVAYYRKYSAIGEWERFEHDVFWGLYDSYINHGGNSFVMDDIEPIMRKLKIKD